MPIESGNFGSEPKNLPDRADIKKEAAALSEKQRKKTFGEKVFSEYQTKKAKVRGTEIDRDVAFRFERGQIYKGYMNVREEINQAEKRGEDTTSKKALLKEMRARAKEVERDLDELNRQYHENVSTIDIETMYGNFTVPVVELDLKKVSFQTGKKREKGKTPSAGKDERIPDFFLGGIATNYFQTACFSMARALEGHKIYVPMQPEQPSVKKPAHFGATLDKEGTVKPYAEFAKRIIEKIGLQDFNLLGYSMGATTALELAKDPELKGLNDLTVIEPLGIQDKGLVRLMMEFSNQSAIKTLPSSEAMIKGFFQGAEAGQGELPLFLKAAQILSKQQFTPETLSAIHQKGRFQVWMGTESPIVNNTVAEKFFKETASLQKEKNPEASPLELYKIKGANHFLPMVNALGLSKMIDGPLPEKQITTIENSDLGNSAMEWMLKDIGN